MRFINALVACSVIAIASSSVLAQSTAVQWTTASGGNGHWYEGVMELTSQPTASLGAEVVGGHLVEIQSAQENSFLTQQNFPSVSPTGDQVGYWIGAVKSAQNGFWTWQTGAPWSYSNFDASEPNGCCGSDVRFVVLRTYAGHEGRWDDTSTNGNQDINPQPRIIEWSADCNSDGIVDYGQCLNGTLPDYNGNNIPDCCEQGVACVAGSYPVCWRIEDGGNGHWYQSRSTNGLTFTAARASARNIGGDLVTLQSALELDFVFRNLAADPSMWWHANGIPRHGPWIGLIQEHADPQYSEPAGGWTWSDGVSATFQSWEPIDPCATQPTDCFCGGSPCGLDNAGFYTGGASGSATAPTWGAFANDMSGRVGGVIIEWSADCNSDGIVDYGQILSGQLIDANSNGIPDICDVDPCPGDISGNGAVDGVDLSVLLGVWGTDGSGGEFDADVTNDGIVNGADLTIILGGWGPCPN